MHLSYVVLLKNYGMPYNTAQNLNVFLYYEVTRSLSYHPSGSTDTRFADETALALALAGPPPLSLPSLSCDLDNDDDDKEECKPPPFCAPPLKP